MASVGKLEDQFEVDGLGPFCFEGDGQPIMASVEKLEDEFEVDGLEPFCYDEAKGMRRAEEERERVRRKNEEKEQKEMEKKRRAEAHQRVKDSIIEVDPKVGCKVYTRFFLRDFSLFDINEKSPIPAMRYADSTYAGEFGLQDSVNILWVSIISSDEGFPFPVYGSVIARDSIDYKCIDLFHRDRDHCQLIVSPDCELDLTGPGRGLVLVDFIYLEIDLKMRQYGAFPDKQLSKGLISIDGRVLSRKKDVIIRSETLTSFRSTVEVRFATVLDAAECHFEIKLVKGDFDGRIAARISRTGEIIVIHHTEEDGVVTDESGNINLRRHIMTVCQSSRMLVLNFFNEADGVTFERDIEFTPLPPGKDSLEFPCGAATLKVEVVWSLMDSRP